MITSDLHLGHKNICKYRTQFSTEEEHNEVMFDNLASSLNKRDTLFMLGDMAFTLEWHKKLSEIKCRHKVLILGNHDTDRSVKVQHFQGMYDKIHSLLSHRNYWFSHCPIHPQELRGRLGNIHGHLHGGVVEREIQVPYSTDEGSGSRIEVCIDTRYLNACVEHTNFKPISFEELIERA